MKSKKKYILKNKKRFISFVIIILSIIFIAVFSDISYGYNEPDYKVISVKYGDTLWDIAKEFKGNRDTRQFIYQLKKINDLKTSCLIEGQEIKVPIN